MKLILLSLLPVVLAAPAPTLDKRFGPTVVVNSPKATIVGRPSLLQVDTFNDIPFAQPPVGDLRLKPPQALTGDQGKVDATTLIPKACPQMYFSTDPSAAPGNALGTILNLPLFQQVQNSGEDCLTLNVQRPASAKAGDKLPVLFWIFGGGFELGSTQMYNGESLVIDSILNRQPIIFVAVNYRVGGFGFMPGKEIMQDGSGNLGLLDQRLGLQWVADNIANFGGDPDKVTIWGESAGAISVMDQMLLYDGDNTYKGKQLFRAGIMNSGSIVPAQPLDSNKGQAIYDTVVKAAGCSGDSNTLACLRKVPYSKFLQAANSVPGILGYFTVNLSYLPRPDGKALTASPDELVAQGKYAKVPFIVGDQEDEGTLFGLFTPNITTTDALTNYLSTYFFDKADPKGIAELVSTYQSTVEDSSPFRTTQLQNWYPQFMRISAILGDLTFTLSRRIFLEGHSIVKPDVPSWSYLSSYDYGTPLLGTFHGSDLLQVFIGVLPNNAKNTIRGYYYNFIYNLDPNKGNKLDNWPQWKDGQKLMNFNANSNKLIGDDFRQDSAQWLKNNVAALRV